MPVYQSKTLSVGFSCAVVAIFAYLLCASLWLGPTLTQHLPHSFNPKVATAILSAVVVFCIQMIFRALIWPSEKYTREFNEEAIDIHYHLGFVATLIAIATSMMAALPGLSAGDADVSAPLESNALQDFIGTVSLNAGAAIVSTVVGLIVRLFAKDKYRTLFPMEVEEVDSTLFQFFRPFSVAPGTGGRGSAPDPGPRRSSSPLYPYGFYPYSHSSASDQARPANHRDDPGDDIQAGFALSVRRAFGGRKPKR